LISDIGVMDKSAAKAVELALGEAAHRPRVSVRDDWYYGGLR